MGLYKICTHKGRARDRCEHAWWGSFRGKRVSLAKWTNREIGSKAEADIALDELRAAIRDGTFDERGLSPPADNSPMTFSKFAEVYKQRHVLAKGLALSSTIDYRLKPLIERFGDRPIAEIKTADIDDFVADLKQPRVVNGLDGRRLTPASINRTLGLLRHMLNWAVGREYLDRTPFRRGTEVLIRMELEDNKRRRRISEAEEAALLAVASPHLRSMIIAALDTGMRRGEMLALQFADIDWKRRMITLRGATTKSRRTRVVPIGTARLLAVLEWLRLDSAGERKGDDVPVFSNEAGEPLKTFKKAWVVAVLKAHGVDPRWRKGSLQGPLDRVSAAVPRHQPALARPEARVRLQAGRARRSARPGARPARSRIDPHDRALRQPETGGTASSRRTAGRRQDVRSEDAKPSDRSFKNLSRSHRTALRRRRRPRQGIRTSH